MKIQIVLDRNGAATQGIDQEALLEDIKAEIGKFQAKTGASVEKKETDPPDGAQGDLTLWQWVIDFAKEPAMAKTYAGLILVALNSLTTAAKTQDKSNKQMKTKPLRVTIKGKEIFLPALAEAIRQFLESLDS